MPCTVQDVSAALRDLLDIFPRTKKGADSPRVAEIYHTVLSRHAPEMLKAGVLSWCATGERFPTPAQLNDACWKATRANTITIDRQDGEYIAPVYSCPDCKATPRLAVLACEHPSGVKDVMRYVMACAPERHHGTPVRVGLPGNFSEWAEPEIPAHVMAASPLERDRRAALIAEKLAAGMGR